MAIPIRTGWAISWLWLICAAPRTLHAASPAVDFDLSGGVGFGSETVRTSAERVSFDGPAWAADLRVFHRAGHGAIFRYGRLDEMEILSDATRTASWFDLAYAYRISPAPLPWELGASADDEPRRNFAVLPTFYVGVNRTTIDTRDSVCSLFGGCEDPNSAHRFHHSHWRGLAGASLDFHWLYSFFGLDANVRYAPNGSSTEKNYAILLRIGAGTLPQPVE